MVEENHLHGTDFEASRQDRIDDLPHIFVLHCMRFDDAKSTVLVVGSGLYRQRSTLTMA